MALSRGSRGFLIALVLLAAIVIAAVAWVNYQLGGESGPGDPLEFVVEQGATAGTIGERLAEEGVVRNALAFRLVARSRDLDENIQAGTYELETGMSVDEAIDALLAGPQEPESYRFTVEEGLPVSLTLERLAEQTPYEVGDFRDVLDARLAAGGNADGVLSMPEWLPEVASFGPDVREPFEGLLFPETYEVFSDATPQQVLQRMVDELATAVANLPQADVEAFLAADFSRYDLLVIASLIERETRVDDERAIVSGVIRNRLEEGMLLQIDATCLYAVGEHKERVLQADCEVESPYNTYLNPGLPPTPISGMGRASLRAAASPEDVTYRYYVLAPGCDGTHVFSDTLEEHNRNVQAFRDAGRCQ